MEPAPSETRAALPSSHPPVAHGFAGAPATVQSDLYALGLILYETYTGRLPFNAATVGE